MNYLAGFHSLNLVDQCIENGPMVLDSVSLHMDDDNAKGNTRARKQANLPSSRLLSLSSRTKLRWTGDKLKAALGEIKRTTELKYGSV